MKSTKADPIARNILRFLAAASLSCALAIPLHAQPALFTDTPSERPQRTFGTPQEAAAALIQAAANYDVPALLEIFGPEGEDFISSADPVQDKYMVDDFSRRAAERHIVTIDQSNKVRAILSVGNDDWPLPVPIVKKGNKWHFDSVQGRDEILFRRIGANELDAIQICRGFVEAQKAYASEIRGDAKIHQYAQRIISNPGKQDGLYWQNADGTPGGPISEAIARAIEEGYLPGKTSGFHGYYFKVLKGQGPAAPLGQIDYVINGVMIGGFALLAFPSEYRVTGVKSFIVSFDGIVYERDLGPKTLEAAKTIERYDPDKNWKRTDDEWPDSAILRAN